LLLLAFCLPFSVFSQAVEPSITIPLATWQAIQESAESLAAKVTRLETSLTEIEAKQKAQSEMEKALRETLEKKLTDSYAYSTKLKKENSALRFWLPVLGTVAAGATIYALLK
jgi:hypothetical protein